MTDIPSSRSDFLMRKSDELLRETAELTALIEAAGQRLADVAAELAQCEGRIALDPRFGVGTWFTAYETALDAFPRRLTARQLCERSRLLAGFVKDAEE
ncbi:MAG: hypothetical protein PHE98_10775 [Thauera propionica]|nr:hypothetical protein [Thauera propionica]